MVHTSVVWICRELSTQTDMLRAQSSVLFHRLEVVHVFLCISMMVLMFAYPKHRDIRTMADQFEHHNLGDYDVVRSTQFADEMTRGVNDASILVFTCISQ